MVSSSDTPIIHAKILKSSVGTTFEAASTVKSQPFGGHTETVEGNVLTMFLRASAEEYKFLRISVGEDP